MNVDTYFVCCFSVAKSCLFVTPWTVAHQAPLSVGILQARILQWVSMPFSRVSSQPRDQTQVSCIAGGFFTFWATIWQITKFLLYQTMQHYKLRCFGLLPRTSKNMFLDFCITCIIVQNTLLCCPGLAYGKTVHLGRVISSSVQFSHSVVPDSLWPHESQHARPPCPSPTPGDHSDSRPSSQWCHPAISSSVFPFSSCPQSLPASESFPMSQLFVYQRFIQTWAQDMVIMTNRRWEK